MAKQWNNSTWLSVIKKCWRGDKACKKNHNSSIAVLLGATEMKKTNQLQNTLQLIPVSNRSSPWELQRVWFELFQLSPPVSNTLTFSKSVSEHKIFFSRSSRRCIANVGKSYTPFPWQWLHLQSQTNKINICRITWQCFLMVRHEETGLTKKINHVLYQSQNIHVSCN